MKKMITVLSVLTLFATSIVSCKNNKEKSVNEKSDTLKVSTDTVNVKDTVEFK